MRMPASTAKWRPAAIAYFCATSSGRMRGSAAARAETTGTVISIGRILMPPSTVQQIFSLERRASPPVDRRPHRPRPLDAEGDVAADELLDLVGGAGVELERPDARGPVVAGHDDALAVGTE